MANYSQTRGTNSIFFGSEGANCVVFHLFTSPSTLTYFMDDISELGTHLIVVLLLLLGIGPVVGVAGVRLVRLVHRVPAVARRAEGTRLAPHRRIWLSSSGFSRGGGGRRAL